MHRREALISECICYLLQCLALLSHRPRKGCLILSLLVAPIADAGKGYQKGLLLTPHPFQPLSAPLPPPTPSHKKPSKKFAFRSGFFYLCSNYIMYYTYTRIRIGRAQGEKQIRIIR